MAAARPAPDNQGRVATRPRKKAPPAAEKKAQLRVVPREQRVRAVGRMGTIFAVFVFATLYALAAMHAVLVQTQAGIDALDTEIRELEEELEARIAREAWLDSPDGLREAAAGVGLVEAPEVVALVPVAAGALVAPGEADPFGSGSAG